MAGVNNYPGKPEEGEGGGTKPALIWITVAVLLLAWVAWSRHRAAPAGEAIAPAAEGKVILGNGAAPADKPVQALQEKPVTRPEPAAGAQSETQKLSPEQAKEPAEPVQVPEGVGFGASMGSRQTPDKADGK